MKSKEKSFHRLLKQTLSECWDPLDDGILTYKFRIRNYVRLLNKFNVQVDKTTM